MTAREEADELKRQAIDVLLRERDAIEAELKALGYGKENGVTTKRRGRPRKAAVEATQGENQSHSATELSSSSRTD